MVLRCLFALALSTTAFADRDAKIDLMAKVAEAHLAQVQLGRLALSRSQDPAVRSLAARMVDEHSYDYSQLKLIADREGVAFPSEPSANYKFLYQDLSQMSGAGFDRAYRESAAYGSDDIVRWLEAARGSTGDPALEQLIVRRLPVLRHQTAEAHRNLM